MQHEKYHCFVERKLASTEVSTEEPLDWMDCARCIVILSAAAWFILLSVLALL